jgi:hypothetical protein
MSAVDLVADGFGAAATAGGVVAYVLIASAVVAGALRERGVAEVCTLWGLGFIALHVVFAAVGGVVQPTFFGVLAVMTAAAVGVALRREVDPRWLAGGVVALWALCALHATVVGGDEKLVRVLVWCSSAAVLTTLAVRAADAWSRSAPEPPARAPGRPHAATPDPEPLESSTHLWSVDGYREATRQSRR